LKRQLAWDKMYAGGKKASPEEQNAEIQRRRVHEEISYPDHHANPLTYLISSAPPNSHDCSVGTHVQTAGNSDTAEANATTTETENTSGHEPNDEISLAWSPEIQDDLAPVLASITPFGQLEAEQWQS
jgi:hypothetical protein